MDRRQFIKTVAATAAVTGLSIKFPHLSAFAEETNKNAIPDIVAVRNGEPAKMFRKGIEELGGMKAFVKPGQKVIIKPNISFDIAPEYGSNTSAELIGEIVSQSIAAGASEVSVFDNTLNNWKSAYKSSGAQDAVKKAGGKLLAADKESQYKLLKNPNAKKLTETAVFKPLLEADVFINVPVLKHHGGAKMSSAIKNLMGAVWNRRIMHRNDLHQSIAEMLLYMKPDLNVVDAYRVIKQNGPRGVNLEDAELVKYQLLSKDIVAVDSAAAKMMSYKLEEVPYIGIAAKLGMGKDDLKNVTIKRVEA